MIRRRELPALALSIVAIVAAVGGGAVAAKHHRHRIDGAAIRAKSIPGNRIKPGTIPADRLAAGVQRALSAPGDPPASVAHADAADAAGHADTAGRADTAAAADTAAHAASADTAAALAASCPAGTRAFAGACWEVAASGPLSAPSAAVACASRGGELPEALQLAGFAHEPGVSLAAAGEWTATIAAVAGPGTFTVVTVDQGGDVDSDVSTASRVYRCALPLAGAR